MSIFDGTECFFASDKEFQHILEFWLKERRKFVGIEIHECGVQKAAEKLLEELKRERN